MYDAVAPNWQNQEKGRQHFVAYIASLLSGAAVKTANDNSAGRHKDSGIYAIFVDDSRPGLKGSDRFLSPN